MDIIKHLALAFLAPLALVLVPLWFLYIVGWCWWALKGFDTDPNY